MPIPTYLTGDTAPVMATVATGKAVAVGDLCGYSGGTLVKASDTTWDTDLATTQAAFAALFLGVSQQTKTNTQSTPFGNSIPNQIRVSTAGVYEYDMASATATLGQYYGAAKNPSSNALVDQVLVGVATEARAVAQCVYAPAVAATRVRVRLLSTILNLSRKA